MDKDKLLLTLMTLVLIVIGGILITSSVEFLKNPLSWVAGLLLLPLGITFGLINIPSLDAIWIVGIIRSVIYYPMLWYLITRAAKDKRWVLMIILVIILTFAGCATMRPHTG